MAFMFIWILNSFAGIHSRESIVSNKPVESELKQNIITGTVTDANTGEAIVGANIIVKGLSTGVISGPDGKFRIEVSDPKVTILFSFVGYNTEEVSVEGKTTIDIKLVPSIQSLNEVVVVGYGTQSKRSVTGSVASVDAAAKL